MFRMPATVMVVNLQLFGKGYSLSLRKGSGYMRLGNGRCVAVWERPQEKKSRKAQQRKIPEEDER